MQSFNKSPYKMDSRAQCKEAMFTTHPSSGAFKRPYRLAACNSLEWHGLALDEIPPYSCIFLTLGLFSKYFPLLDITKPRVVRLYRFEISL